MPRLAVSKASASKEDQLAYIEAIAQTKLGLQSSSRSLLARRAYADADETRTIDIELDLNDSEWSRVNAAETAFYSRNVVFNPPTPDDLETMRRTVKDLDAFTAQNAKAQDIVAKTTSLIQQFKTMRSA